MCLYFDGNGCLIHLMLLAKPLKKTSLKNDRGTTGVGYKSYPDQCILQNNNVKSGVLRNLITKTFDDSYQNLSIF